MSLERGTTALPPRADGGHQPGRMESGTQVSAEQRGAEPGAPGSPAMAKSTTKWSWCSTTSRPEALAAGGDLRQGWQ